MFSTIATGLLVVAILILFSYTLGAGLYYDYELKKVGGGGPLIKNIAIIPGGIGVGTGLLLAFVLWRRTCK